MERIPTISFRKHAVNIGAFSYLAAVSLGLAVTNSLSLDLFPQLRWIFLSLAAAIYILYHLTEGFNKDEVYSISLLSLSCIIGLAIPILNETHSYPGMDVFISFIMVLMGIFYLSRYSSTWSNSKINRQFSIFALGIFLFNVATGGFQIDFPPRFIYDIATESYSDSVLYNQGTSAFFGLAAIFSLNIASQSRSASKAGMWVVLWLFFLLLSFIGGGRGEFLAVFLISSLFGLRERRLRPILVAVALIGVLVYRSSTDRALIEQLTAFARFTVIFQNADLGMRDILFSDALKILLTEPRCVIIGCGYGYFQDHYGYPLSLYPHNIVLEAMITWGVLQTAILAILTAYGALKLDGHNALPALSLFFIFSAMKSGSAVTNWLAYAAIFQYSGFALAVLTNGRSKASDKFT